jgi:hypothetical protein
MKPLTRGELESLMEHRGDPSVSIYAPMVKAGPETQQNPIRFKNLVREALDALQERGLEEKEAEALLAPAIDLIDTLKQKTAGTLTAQEADALEDVLYRLRVRYVQKRR